MKKWRYEDKDMKMKIWRWRYEDMKIWRYEDMKIWRYEDMKIKRYEDIKMLIWKTSTSSKHGDFKVACEGDVRYHISAEISS